MSLSNAQGLLNHCHLGNRSKDICDLSPHPVTLAKSLVSLAMALCRKGVGVSRVMIYNKYFNNGLPDLFLKARCLILLIKARCLFFL